jgi:transcription initiation factor TFIIE subunit alpha
MFFCEKSDARAQEIAAQGYVCPLCKKTYSLLDIQHCVDFATGAFHCEICGSELVDNDSVTEINSSREQVKRFLEQCKFIIDALQKAEDIVLPSFDIARWLHVNFPLDKTGAPAESAAAPVAGPSAPLNAVTVKLETDADIEAPKIKEEEDELVKRCVVLARCLA